MHSPQQLVAELALGRIEGSWLTFTRMLELETRHASLGTNRARALAGVLEATTALGIPAEVRSDLPAGTDEM